MSLRDDFSVAVKSQGRRASWDPWQFVDAWEAFVIGVEDGYQGDLYEYENELSVRDDLQRALRSPALAACAEWGDLRDRILSLDDRLRSVLVLGPEVRPNALWWWMRLPAVAGDEFAQDARRVFGVEVAVD